MTKEEPKAIDNSTTATRPARRRKHDNQDKSILAMEINIPGYNCFWAIDNDDKKPGRIQNLTLRDDYEKVTEEELAQLGYVTLLEDHKPGTVFTTPGGVNNNGQQTTHYLLKKPEDYWYEDKKREARINIARVDDTADHPELGGVVPDISPDQQGKIDPNKVIEYSKQSTSLTPSKISHGLK